jgi:hypothetical protein
MIIIVMSAVQKTEFIRQNVICYNIKRFWYDIILSVHTQAED